MKKSARDHSTTGLWPQLTGPLLAVCVVVAIELLSRRTFKLANPPAMLILIVVFSAFIGGLRSGLVTAVIAWVYFAYFFSIPGRPFHHTAENLQRIIMWAVTTPAMAVMVGILKRRAERAVEVSSRGREEEAHNRLAAIVESSGDAILGRNLEGIILSWNASAERIFGYTAEEIVGRSVSLLVPADRPDEIPTILERLKRGERVEHFETVRVCKDDKQINVSLTISPIKDAAGNIIGASTIARDISERKRAGEALSRAREADRANQAKSEFLSRMSHELRTPLNAILGFAQLLELDRLTPEQRESVGHILKGGQHLLDLINEVLDIARIEAGRLALSQEPVLVQEIVKETMDLAAPLAAAADVHLRADVADLPKRYVVADRQRIKQVLLNLLSNAIKYNRRGGMVTLSCEEVPPERFRINIRDTGPGISPEHLERLFTPFDRLGADESLIEGTGLGLALSKRLVEAMGGTMGVESLVGRGSTFWGEFALAEGPEQRVQRESPDVLIPAAHPVSSKRRVVLYVEDNLSNLKLVERLLAHRPEVKLISAMQGRLGLDLTREHHPHLILLDLHLPDIPGDEVLRQLRESPGTRQIPVVIISADATSRQIERLRADGARAYLTKPLDVKKFLALVDEILGNGESAGTR